MLKAGLGGEIMQKSYEWKNSGERRAAGNLTPPSEAVLIFCVCGTGGTERATCTAVAKVFFEGIRNRVGFLVAPGLPGIC